jgi:hypothetical protein
MKVENIKFSFEVGENEELAKMFVQLDKQPSDTLKQKFVVDKVCCNIAWLAIFRDNNKNTKLTHFRFIGGCTQDIVVFIQFINLVLTHDDKFCSIL